MGYSTYARGVITIVPPIPYAGIKDSPFLPDGDENTDLKFVLAKQEQHTPDGILTIIVATGVEQRYDDDPRNYFIVTHLQLLVDAFPGHTFRGRLDCEGDNSGDMWRLKVVDGKATKFKPQLIWPEASE